MTYGPRYRDERNFATVNIVLAAATILSHGNKSHVYSIIIFLYYIIILCTHARVIIFVSSSRTKPDDKNRAATLRKSRGHNEHEASPFRERFVYNRFSSSIRSHGKKKKNDNYYYQRRLINRDDYKWKTVASSSRALRR